MSEEKEPFLARWSRLKREAPAAAPAPKKDDALPAKRDDAAPRLPPLESVTPQSDFAPFMHPEVGDDLRRLALKKLFSDPHFNVPDPFEPYSRDWNNLEPLEPELLAQLNQARTVLFTPEQKPADKPIAGAESGSAKRETAPLEDAKDLGEAKPDEPRRQDT